VTTYSLKLRVYYEDTDAGGIVYHARYLAFAERARTEALREAGVPHDELVTQFGLIFVVRRIEMDYLRAVRLDAEVIVETGPWALGGATIDVQQRFGVSGEETGRLRVGLACVRVADGRPARIPLRWRDALRAGRG
jgi:acyl-CoA thioester hydrolase